MRQSNLVVGMCVALWHSLKGSVVYMFLTKLYKLLHKRIHILSVSAQFVMHKNLINVIVAYFLWNHLEESYSLLPGRIQRERYRNGKSNYGDLL